MQTFNRSTVREFILLGLTHDPLLKFPLFLFFLLVYIITVLGNVGIMALIQVSSHLHTPMYFLLYNLAFADVCYSTILTPKMLDSLLTETETISFTGCAAQMFLSVTMGSTEVLLLAVMAYDRYIAICSPFTYYVTMNNISCICFMIFTYAISISHALTHTICTFRMSFCGSNVIAQYFCDIPALLKISCSETTVSELLLMMFSGGIILISFSSIIVSYTFIISAILMIRSTEGRWKAFSTCSSHLVCVNLFFCTLVFMYVKPNSSQSMAQDRVLTVIYTAVLPMLNPLIYSFRNQEVKKALLKVTNKICH